MLKSLNAVFSKTIWNELQIDGCARRTMSKLSCFETWVVLSMNVYWLHVCFLCEHLVTITLEFFSFIISTKPIGSFILFHLNRRSNWWSININPFFFNVIVFQKLFIHVISLIYLRNSSNHNISLLTIWCVWKLNFCPNKTELGGKITENMKNIVNLMINIWQNSEN